MDRELNIICSTCDKPITGMDGCLWISRSDVLEAQDAHHAWMQEYATPTQEGGHIMGARGLAAMPNSAVWRAGHDRCDGDEVNDMYSIPAFKLQTWSDLVLWTAQLSEKRWLKHTNWFELTRAVAERTSRLIVPVER